MLLEIPLHVSAALRNSSYWGLRSHHSKQSRQSTSVVGTAEGIPPFTSFRTSFLSSTCPTRSSIDVTSAHVPASVEILAERLCSLRRIRRLALGYFTLAKEEWAALFMFLRQKLALDELWFLQPLTSFDDTEMIVSRPEISSIETVQVVRRRKWGLFTTTTSNKAVDVKDSRSLILKTMTVMGRLTFGLLKVARCHEVCFVLL